MAKKGVLLILIFWVSSCRPDKKKMPLAETAQINLSPKVEAIFRKMTLDEKIGQLNLIRPAFGVKTGDAVSADFEKKILAGQVGAVLGVQGKQKIRKIQEIAVDKSRLGIPLIFGLDVIHGYKTTFPIPLALSCTWDSLLIQKMARISASEATSDGLMWTFSPMVDIARDPRWGRIAESAGEDPFLGSMVARVMVKGYQGDSLSNPETMMACVKHFALYGAPEGGRDYATVDMSRIRMHNEYLPPYRAAIDAGVKSVMTSFNVVDYVPASANSYLLNGVLRERWGFDGFVVTDYTAINEMTNHGIGDLQKVSQRAIRSNVDMDMVGEGFLTTLKQSIEMGEVSIGQIDIACRRILKAKELLGLFDDPYLYLNGNPENELLSKNNRAFGRKVAAASCVLLKNQNNLLPLSRKSKIALIGPLAHNRRNMLGCWSVAGDSDSAITLMEGLQTEVGADYLLYAKGCNITDNPDLAKKINALGEEVIIDKRTPDELIQEALEVAQKSDVIIAALGEVPNMTGESSSMANIGLQPAQRKLLKALKTTGKPIILVLFNGRPMILTWEQQHIDAMLDVWFGGTEAGNAISDVIFGKVNPSGKLTTSFPVHIGQIPVYHSMLNTGRPNRKTGRKFASNYLDINNEPLYPFGYGLSYTTFKYEHLQLSDSLLISGKTITASVTISNTGPVKGKETIQLYIRDLIGSISRPVKELKGFRKVELKPGEQQVVSFIISSDLLKFYDQHLNYVAEEGDFELYIGGDSAHLLKTKFTLNFE